MEKLRFGIIGCGDIATHSFAPSLLKSSRVELVAACRRQAAKAREFASRFGNCKAYGAAEPLLDDDEVEAVIVSTPTDSHRHYVLQAAARGKHVLCEKPMASNTAECREMIAACKEAGVVLGVAYRRRLFPQVLKAKEWIEAGRIGRVVCVRTHYSGFFEVEEAAWRRRPGIGGAMMEMAVHRLEVLLHFAGQPAALSALVETVEHDWEVDDSDAIVLKFTDGKIGVHSTILTSKPRRDTAQIDGTKGRIVIDPLEFYADHIEVETEKGREPVPVEPLEKPYFDLPMIDDFAAAVRQKREPVCHALAGYWTQAVTDAAFRSAKEKRQVEVEPF